ncbi:MAG: efflux RND transporter periplasmic adaptor subunit [Gammaproteobacteria bacterium]
MRARSLAVAFLLLWVRMVVAADASVPFPTALAEYQSIPQQWTFDGVIEAVQQATVSAQTSGRIVAINFDVQDFVKKGEVILRIKDTEQRARLEAAKASLAEARARLAQAQKEYTRIKSIYARKLVAKSAMDKATAELKAAQARREAAESRVQEAQEQLDHTVVRAPYSGIVVKRHVELGETASVGQPLMTGLSLEHLRATVALPQGLVQQVRANDKAFVVLPGPPRKRLEADKLVVFPYADPVSHTFKVRVNLPQGISGLYPGMLIKVGFVTGTTRGLLIPAAAVVYRSEVTGVYVVSPKGRVALREIRLGRRYGDNQYIVLAGLQQGERVALDPIQAGVYLKKQWSEGHS